MTDLAVLHSANDTVAILIEEMRAGLENGAPLREQIPRIRALAEQYDLVGMPDAAANFHRQADALIPLRDYQDSRDAEEARRAERRRRWMRMVRLGR